MTDKLKAILKTIENLDEYDAEEFYKALARQSHTSELQIFIDELGRRGE